MISAAGAEAWEKPGAYAADVSSVRLSQRATLFTHAPEKRTAFSMILMKHATPFIARAVGRAEGTVAEYVRQLRLSGRIAGKDKKGKLAQPASTADVSRVLLALLSGERPAAAPDDLSRSAGLVTADGRYLLSVLEEYLSEIVEHGQLLDVRELKLSVSRPWPGAVLKSRYSDGRTEAKVFHHEKAKSTGGPELDERTLDTLMRQWGYRPGMTVWSEIDLRNLAHVGLALAGRATDAERHAPRGDEARLWGGPAAG
jgi:hypothetical protein